MSDSPIPTPPTGGKFPPKWAVIAEGILFDILGVLAILFPILASVAIEQLLGILCVVAGVFALGNTFLNKATDHRFSGVISGLILVVVGLLLLVYVKESLQTLALIVGIGFALEGILQIATGLSRKAKVKLWPMLVLNGVVSLVLAALIFLQWPESSAFILGLLFGINLMFAGATLIAIGMALPSNSDPKH